MVVYRVWFFDSETRIFTVCFPGCPEVRRKEFLKNLREFFKERMQAAMNESDSTR